MSIVLTRCGHLMHLLIPGSAHLKKQKPDNSLISGIAQGHEWLDLLTSGKASGVGDIAEVESVVSSHITRTIYRAFLAPDIVHSILDGSQPPHFTPDFLKQHLPLPIDWNDQRRMLGFPVR